MQCRAAEHRNRAHPLTLLALHAREEFIAHGLWHLGVRVRHICGPLTGHAASALWQGNELHQGVFDLLVARRAAALLAPVAVPFAPLPLCLRLPCWWQGWVGGSQYVIYKKAGLWSPQPPAPGAFCGCFRTVCESFLDSRQPGGRRSRGFFPQL